MPILPTEPDMFPDDLWDNVVGASPGSRLWFCLHTKPRQEKAMARDLRAGRIAFYLPLMVREHRTPAGRKIRSVAPLFGGYLFLFGDEAQRREALRGNRLVGVLDVVDQVALAQELRQIHRMLHSGLAIEADPSAPVGGRVQIASGPLTGLVGTVIRRGKRNHFVALISLLGLGATVALEDWQVRVLSSDAGSAHESP